MICPITTEQITKSHDSRDELIRQWQTIFCIASGIHFFGVIFYAIFASGEIFFYKNKSFLESQRFFFFSQVNNKAGPRQERRKRKWR